jgi:hypothetical protein
MATLPEDDTPIFFALQKEYAAKEALETNKDLLKDAQDQK